MGAQRFPQTVRSFLKHGHITAGAFLLAACRDATPAVSPGVVSATPNTHVVAAAAAVGTRFPSIVLRTLTGDSVRLGGAGPQPLTLVNMWATWCGPCKKEFPDLQALHEQYGRRGLRLIAVSTDQQDVPVRAFVMSTNATFLIGRDTAEDVLAFLRDGSLPQNVLIGADGRILYKAFGAHRPVDPALKAAIESALGGA